MAAWMQAVRFASMCSMMVSKVEPLAQRIQPSSRPMQKICASVNASYCTCIAVQADDVAIIAPETPSHDALKPRNRKPRNAISSLIGATITTARKNNGSEPDVHADK